MKRNQGIDARSMDQWMLAMARRQAAKTILYRKTDTQDQRQKIDSLKTQGGREEEREREGANGTSLSITADAGYLQICRVRSSCLQDARLGTH